MPERVRQLPVRLHSHVGAARPHSLRDMHGDSVAAVGHGTEVWRHKRRRPRRPPAWRRWAAAVSLGERGRTETDYRRGEAAHQRS